MRFRQVKFRDILFPMNTTLTREAVASSAVHSKVEQVLDAVRAFSGQPLTGRVATLVAQAPFLAGSPRAKRDAQHNLTIYASELHQAMHPIYTHSPLDDDYTTERLKPMALSSGGDPKVLRHVEGLLGLIMVEGYQRSADKDRADGSYNPFVSGAWSYSEKKAELLGLIADNFSEAVDGVMTVREAEVMFWWG